MRICLACGARYPDARRQCDAHPQRALTALGDVPGDELIGELVDGRYLVLDRLAEGEVGVVYRAWHREGGHEVALKVIRDGRITAEQRSRFLREAALGAGLTGPHAVRVHGHGALADGGLYLAMERVIGPTLAETLAEQGRVGLNRVKRLGLELCDALTEAHAQGLVHRDVRPANLMLAERADGGERLVLVGVGATRLSDLEARTLSREGLPLESLGAMSPEQLEGGEVGPASDIYCAGLTLFTLATGALPFRGGTASAVIFQQLSEPAPHLMSFLGTTPTVAALDAVIQRCLRKAPKDRFPTARALREALEGVPHEPRSGTLTGITRAPPPTRQPTRPRLETIERAEPAVMGETRRRLAAERLPSAAEPLTIPPDPWRRVAVGAVVVAAVALATYAVIALAS